MPSSPCLSPSPTPAAAAAAATHAHLSATLSTLLPPSSNDISFHYHTPSRSQPSPTRTPCTRLVLAITPTPSFYRLLNARPSSVGFLHRPFALDRRRVRAGSLILASHAVFDERLTVGWNAVLAGRLLGGAGPERRMVEVRGYKNDAERRVGLIGRTGMGVAEVKRRVWGEFCGWDCEVGVGDERRERRGGADAPGTVLALMNAFNAETVERTVRLAACEGWVDPERLREGSRERILYVTGAPRETGLLKAKEVGVDVICVGHRRCEEWGIRYLAERFRAEYPGLEVLDIYEPEDCPNGSSIS